MPVNTLQFLGLGSGSVPGPTIGNIGADATRLWPNVPIVSLYPPSGRDYLGVSNPRITGPARGSPAGLPMQARDAPTLMLTRERIARELEDNPALARRFDISTTAEVGSSPDARRKYQASVIDRAAATQRPLADVLTDPSYYPPETLRATRASGLAVDPELWAGANPANFATGNASLDPRTGRWVGFGGGPQTAMSGSGRGAELYGMEAVPGYKEYADYVGYGGPMKTAIGPSGPSGPTDTTPLGWQETVSASPSGVGYVPEEKVAQGATTNPEDLKPGGPTFMDKFYSALGSLTPKKPAAVPTIPQAQYGGAAFFRPAPIGGRGIR